MSERCHQKVNLINRWLSGASLIAIIALVIFMAQPWGDNYAYRDISGYVNLAVLMAWIISPYLHLLLTANRRYLDRASDTLRVAVVVLVCAGGVGMSFHTVFFILDAQGPLLFLFLPAYQWTLVILLEITLLLRRFKSR